jgi:toxin-antitoxin system PIN domain toxin
MFVVDTNVLVDAFDAPSPWHRPCRALLERWRAQPGAWHLTWSVVYEFMRVMTHRARPRPLTSAQALAAIESLLAAPGLSILTATPRHLAVLREVLVEAPEASGNLLHDAHVVALMREHGISRIYTRDVGLHRFPGVEVIDPTRPSTPAGPAERVGRYGRRSRRR